MIKFRCENCNQKISVRKSHTSKKDKCPKCGNIIVVPQTGNAGSVTAESGPGDLEISPKASDLDPRIFDIPQKSETTDQLSNQEPLSGKTFERLQELEGDLETQQTEQVVKRKLPWIIGIFLYPVTLSGLINLAIFVAVPLLINVVHEVGGWFALLMIFPGTIISIVIRLYMFWYFSECIHDSASGGTQAPEIFGVSSDLNDMFWQMVEIVGCLIFFLGPAYFYKFFTGRADAVFWIFLGYGIFFFPMAILVVIISDFSTGFNPIVLIRSIFNTFVPYCGLNLLFCGAILIAKSVHGPQVPLILASIGHCVCIYSALVLAHLLGRFYWRYEDKLNWEA